VLVVLNMSGTEQKVSIDLSAQGLSAAKMSTLLSTSNALPASGGMGQMSMAPFSVYIAEIVK
jgi:hypothetical protein